MFRIVITAITVGPTSTPGPETGSTGGAAEPDTATYADAGNLWLAVEST